MAVAPPKAPSEYIVLHSYDNKEFDIHVSLKLSQYKDIVKITGDISSDNLDKNMKVGVKIVAIIRKVFKATGCLGKSNFMPIGTKLQFTAMLISTDKLKDDLFIIKAKATLQEIIHALPNPFEGLPFAAEEPKRLTNINISLSFT